MSNIVAIVGRPNVGKSTLFNRLTESQEAIVDETSGVTRDRHYGQGEWKEYKFSVIDTGGVTSGSDDKFESEINRQVDLAIDEASTILFMVDVETGITDFDSMIAEKLRKANKNVLVLANKCDTFDRIPATSEFYAFGLGEVYPICSSSGSQTGDMLDALVETFPEVGEEVESDIPRISVVGRPNVGKSSFINALMGQDRNVVTDESGTTRDSIDTHYNGYGFEFTLVDTAGIRRKSKVHEDIEYYSVLRSQRAIEGSDVCILILDATLGIEKQDLHIYYQIERNKKGIVVLVNKWDLVEKDTKTMKEYEEIIKERLAPFTDVPIVFTSTITKQRIHKAIETAIEVYQSRTQRISTSTLNEVLGEVIEHNPPPSIKGKYVRIKYITQLPTYTPSFAFFCNLPQYVKDPYKRYLENQIREKFNFTGVPINIFFRKK